MIAFLVSGLLAPLIKLGERYIAAKTEREALKAGTERVAIEADAAVRRVKLGYLLGRLPLFAAEMSAAGYFAAVMVDSLFPSDWLNPLELPQWFMPHFGYAMISLFGLSIVSRWK